MKFRLTLGGWNYRLVIHDGDLLLETVTFQALARIVHHLHAVYDKHPDRWFCSQLVEHCTLRFHNLFSYHSPWWHQDISYKQSEHHGVATVWVCPLSLLSIRYELANNISVQLWAEDNQVSVPIICQEHDVRNRPNLQQQQQALFKLYKLTLLVVTIKHKSLRCTLC